MRFFLCVCVFVCVHKWNSIYLGIPCNFICDEICDHKWNSIYSGIPFNFICDEICAHKWNSWNYEKMYQGAVFFFFYVKKKLLREAIFLHFFHFFHARKRFSRTVCVKIFTAGNRFHAHFQIIFSRIAWNFSRKGFYFHVGFFLSFSNLINVTRAF